MLSKLKKITRREFFRHSTQTVAGITGTAALSSCAVSAKKSIVIDGHMHLENNGKYWDGLIEEVIEHNEYAGVDKSVIFVTWTPSHESNDRTFMAYQKYPDLFIPFGHVRPVDSDWEIELKRVSEPPWKGLKLHQGELKRGGSDLKETTRTIVGKAADFGIRVILIHLVDYEIIDELTKEFSELIWILAHMGCQRKYGDVKKYCELAKNRKNIYLDTASYGDYEVFGQAFQWAGIDKIIFATDGFEHSPLVEKAKIETLKLPAPYRAPRLTDEELNMILGENLTRVLEL